MAMECEVLRLLERARLPESEVPASGTKVGDTQSSRVPARDILARVLLICQQTAVPSLGRELHVGELLARTAEAAIQQGDNETALESSVRFFCECSARNQFYCRALLARAQCESHGARLEVGPAKLRKLLNALHFVAQVLPIATDAKKRPAYDFLVYNASVVYWQIARQMMKKSTFQFLVPSLTAIVDALKIVKEEDVLWVARLQMALVHAFIDSGQLLSAAKTVNEVVDERLAPLLGNPAWSTGSELRDLYEEALTLQVHVGSLKDAECQKIVPVVKKAVQSSPNAKRLGMLIKLQCLKSGNLQGTPEQAYGEIFHDATGMCAFSAATTTETDVRGFVAMLDAEALSAMDAEILIEAAIHAVLNGYSIFASCCDVAAEHLRKNMHPRHRLLHQVLKVLLLTASGAANHDQRRLSILHRQQAMVSRRVEGVKTLERTLLAVKRLGDQSLIERVCMLTWNLALPLLQHHLRPQVERAFTLASTTLEEQESLLLEFRARLYLEVAKLDAASDFLVKANNNAAKALGLDYGTITHHSAQPISVDDLCSHAREWTSRPTDFQLEWIKRVTRAKLSPESTREPGDSVFVMLEQVKDTKDKMQQRQLLVRCRDTLEKLEQPESVVALDAVLLMMLWGEVATAAWKVLRDSELTRQVITHTLDTCFPGDKQDTPLLRSRTCNIKSAMMYEIDLRLLLAEVIGEDIKCLRDRANHSEKSPTRGGSRHGSGSSAAAFQDAGRTANADDKLFVFGICRVGADEQVENVSDSEVNGERTLAESDIAKWVMELKLELLSNLTASIAAATRVGWALALENTCVYLWNYHFHVFLMLLEDQRGPGSSEDKFPYQMILPECVSAFEAAFSALESAEIEVSRDLVSCLALGLCTLYEKSGRWDKAAATADAVFKRSLRSPSTEKGAERDFSVLHLKQFAELKARAQIAQNAKDVSFPDGWVPALKVVGFLEVTEVLSQTPEGGSGNLNAVPDKAQACYEKAVTLWQAAGSQLLAELQDVKCTWSLEECQQHTELMAEIWVRIGFGALRLRYPRYAIECADQALVPALQGSESYPSWKSLIVASTNAWFALAEFIYSASILGLVHGQKVPQKLMCAASSHLAQIGSYAMVAGSKPLISKACELLWNGFIESDLADPDAEVESDSGQVGDYLQRLSEYLCVLLRLLQQTPRTTAQASAFHGDMILLTLDICERRGDWGRAFQVASDALATARSNPSNIALSSDAEQQIQTVYAIAAINTGKTALSNSVGGTWQRDGKDPVLQSQILKQIAAASSKDPPAQLKLLTTAHSELQGLRAEQAVALTDVAEFMLTNCLPIHDVHSYLDSATATLLASEQAERDRSPSGQSRRSASSRHLAATATPTTGTKNEQTMHPLLWYVEKLLRVFTVKAEISADYKRRASFITLALHQIERAWGILIGLANELDLQSSFEQAKATGGATVATVEFDTWKSTTTPKFSAPRSSSDWISFYLEHEKSVKSRFNMLWVQALQPVLNSGSKVITDAGLLLYHLESLVTMLQRDGRFDLILPVICLYQVLLYSALPRRAELAVLWSELVLFVTTERLNMTAVLSFPLQKALAIVNAQEGKITHELKESLSTLYRRSHGDGPLVRVRGLVPHAATDSVKNALASVSLLLDTGFIRQAKGLLDVLVTTASATKLAGVHEVVFQCQMLSSRVLEIEGRSAMALTKLKPTGNTPLQLVRYLDWALYRCKFTVDFKEKLRILTEASTIGANTLISYADAEQQQSCLLSSKASLLSGDSPAGSISNSATPSLDASAAMARVKFKLARVFLKQATPTALNTSQDTVATADLLRSSKMAFEDARQLLQGIAALDLCGKFMLRYAALLSRLHNADESSCAIADKLALRRLMSEAIELIESGAERVECKRWDPVKSGMQVDLPTAMLWEIQVAAARLQAASVEIELESASNVVEAHEMTWYEYVRNTQRTVVEKWLAQTDARIVRPEGGDLAYAMALITCANSVAERAAGATDLRALIRVKAAQCQRLLLCHAPDKNRSDAFRQLLWTKFGGPSTIESPDQVETWICANSGTDGSLPTEEGGTQDAENRHDLVGFVDSSVTTLLACQRTALELRSVDLARRTAYELVQVFGCRRPFESAMNLLLYQSCLACKHMENLLQLCLEPSSVQSLHLRRMKRLSKFHANAPSTSLPFQLSQLYMDQQSDAFKRMSLGAAPVDTIVASLPPNYRILCLQFTPEKCFLYAALVTVGGDKRCTMARMEFTRDQTAVLDELRNRLDVWRASMARTLISLEEEHGRDETFEFVATNLPPALSLTLERDALEKEISAVVRETGELLRPLFSHPTLQAELKSELPGNPLVLLVDRALSDLPLEGLPFFDAVESIARDFSIHMLHHRVSAVKAQLVRRDEVRTIVDPHRDDSGGPSGQTMESVIKQLCKTPGGPLQWKDAVEHGQIPSVTDWQNAVIARRGGSLLYVGPNRVVGSSLPLSQLAGMNVAASCHVLLLLDQAESVDSLRRQSKCDNDKPAWQLRIEEDVYLRALLLSLAGVNAVVLNQWATTFSGNRRLASSLLQGLAKGQSIGRVLKAYGESTVSTGTGSTTGSSNTTSASSLPPGSNPPSQTSSASALGSPDSGSGGARAGGKMRLKNRLRFNTVVYGLAHLGLKGGE